jgi:hypothetical protein
MPISNQDIMRRAHNNRLVESLEKFELEGTLDSKAAVETYDVYENLQKKLIGVEGVKQYYMIKRPKNEKSCEICGYPVESLLTTHHLDRKKDGNHVIKLCYNCHTAIHKFIHLGYIDANFIDYLGEKQSVFMMYLKRLA